MGLHPRVLTKNRNISFWRDPVWWVWRQQLAGGDEPHTRDGAANLKRVQRRLSADDGSQLYDVMGVVERWADTCEILDAVLPFPQSVLNANNTVSSCAFESAEHRDSHGSERWWRDEKEARTKARLDAEVRRLLAADITIYQEAVLPVFERALQKSRREQRGSYRT